MDFIVLDELGSLPFAQSGGQLLFHLVSRLYEQSSGIVTTPDSKIKSPALDPTPLRLDQVGPQRLPTRAALSLVGHVASRVPLQGLPGRPVQGVNIGRPSGGKIACRLTV